MREQWRPMLLLDLAAGAGQNPQGQASRTVSDQRLTEKGLAKVRRATENREFASEEELNAFVSDYVERGMPEEGDPLTPLEQAQELVYEAWETDSVTERWRLAKRALRLSPDCADAYILLAEAAEPDLWEMVRLYREGVAAGERALGPEAWSEELDHWWGDIARRPYLRARARLASVLWRLGRWEEAAGHLRELLRLNPRDNQGLRFRLFNWLVFLGEPETVQQLLDAYPEEGASAWLYTRALWTFRQGGPSVEATRQLKLAWEKNRHVPALLLGLIPLPKSPPEIFLPGGEDEAVLYVLDARQAWRQVEGALPWLVDTLADELNATLKPNHKTGRNEPCPCGSGKKYKRCCLGKEAAVAARALLNQRSRPWDLDEVRAMTTPAILAKLASLGLAVSEEDVRQGARVHSGAVALSEAWIAAHPFTATGFDEDFPWFAAWTLWERLNLRPLPLDTVYDLIREERERRDSDRLPNPDNWLRAWAYLKEHLLRMDLHTLQEADQVLGADFNLRSWFVEFMRGLTLEAKEDSSYLVALLTELREFLRLFSPGTTATPEAEKLEQMLRHLLADRQSGS
ncbi:MAG: SEC-C metal-binding domain-containing protein [Bacillota bacterium]|nr:SEC-C metal-binding domain-containing protein [Bacillota bacterium]